MPRPKNPKRQTIQVPITYPPDLRCTCGREMEDDNILEEKWDDYSHRQTILYLCPECKALNRVTRETTAYEVMELI